MEQIFSECFNVPICYHPLPLSWSSSLSLSSSTVTVFIQLSVTVIIHCRCLHPAHCPSYHPLLLSASSAVSLSDVTATSVTAKWLLVTKFFLLKVCAKVTRRVEVKRKNDEEFNMQEYTHSRTQTEAVLKHSRVVSMLVNQDVQDCDLLWSPFLTPLFWPIGTGSDKSGWYHMADKLPSCTILTLCKSLSAGMPCLSLNEVNCFMPYGMKLLQLFNALYASKNVCILFKINLNVF